MVKVLRILLVLFYGFAGIYHFVNPEFYFGLIPDYLPFPEFLNYASGALEIIFGIGAIFPQFRKISVYGIIILLIMFIPSHVYFIQQDSCVEGSLCVSPWISWARLLLIHPLLIYWAWILRE